MEITFKDLKRIHSANQKNDDKVLIDYLNSFDGSNTFEKFKNILIDWEQDVSSTLNLNIKDKPTKIALSYLVSEISTNIGGEIKIKEDDLEIVVDIPKYYDTLVQETLPIYSLIQYIKLSGISINLLDLPIEDKMTIISNLPAKVYNTILKAILSNNDKNVGFTNPLLANIKFNFLTNEPFLFLKGLFTNFGEDYFRDVVFHLSKRIDGNILLNSTPAEIEYYIQRYSEETKSQSNGLTI